MQNLNTGPLSLINKTAKTTAQKGQEIEVLVDNYLQEQGLRLISRNFRCRLGEIDLVYQQQDRLIFVEVRFRRTLDFGGPLASITYQKQRKLIRTARFFLLTHPKLVNLACRFDVVAVTLKDNKPDIEWVQNAFY